MNEDEELLDLVDENNEVIGTIARGDMMQLRQTSGKYLRAVDVFIQRSNGDIYLPRRAMHKKIAPGGLDASASGHVPSGETYEQAAIREIHEETGINVTINDLVFIATLRPTPVLFYFRKLYLLHSDQIPQLSPEHTEAVWVAPQDLANFVRNDIPTKETLNDDIPALLNYFSSTSSTATSGK